jgi:hypothetical protein
MVGLVVAETAVKGIPFASAIAFLASMVLAPSGKE